MDLTFIETLRMVFAFLNLLIAQLHLTFEMALSLGRITGRGISV